MKYIIFDRDLDELGAANLHRQGWATKYPLNKILEFDDLELFANWTVEVDLPRHRFIPPTADAYPSIRPGRSDLEDVWIIYCESSYD